MGPTTPTTPPCEPTRAPTPPTQLPPPPLPPLHAPYTLHCPSCPFLTSKNQTSVELPKKKTAIDRSPHSTQISCCFPFSFPPPLDLFFSNLTHLLHHTSSTTLSALTLHPLLHRERGYSGRCRGPP